jgi:AraC-like DNA-binding protein
MVHKESQHTTLISVASILIDTLEFYGLDYRPIIAEAGFDPNKVYPHSTRLSTAKLQKLWQLAVQYSGDSCFGLTYARYIQPSTLHGLGLSWIASHTLKEGLERLVRFQRILSSDLNLELRETNQGYCIYNTVSQSDDPLQFPDADYHSGIASIYKVCQIMLGPDIRPLRVEFEHDAPDCLERFESFFGIAVEFNGGETAIEFDKALCESPNSSSNPDLTRINDQVVVDYLGQFEKDDIATQTRKFIIDHLPSGVPRQSAIASDLNMSLRSYQRRLKQAGTSFAELLDNVRHEMACSYLESPQHQIIKIAYLLGYSDPSNFARAFKRWDGLTPNEFRHNLLL